MKSRRRFRSGLAATPWIVLVAGVLCSLLLSAAAYSATLPSGFAETRVATGLAAPTAMAVAPDGRIFITQQGGALRVVKNGALLTQPFLTVSVNAAGERGLLGVAFDPNFASNNFVYVYYTTATTPNHNRVSRFTASAANADVAAAGSEVQLLNLPNLSSATNHNGGAIHFGTDGKLYIAVGENANSSNAPSLTTTLGKILRINPDGSIPSDNPFFSQTTGINQAIWARGLRNPFTFGVDPTNGRIHINDVGEGTWEEVNQGVAGSNYGWPQTEGPNPAGVAGVRYPIHSYTHASGGCAITGGAFYRPTTATFPPEYAGLYFFGDYCGGFIRTLAPPNYTTSTPFATGISSLADIQVHPDGSLYYLARGAGGDLFRVQYTANTAPTISSQPANITVAAGQSATFAVTASGTAPLAYQWQRNGANIAGANARTYSFTTSAADSGAMFRVLVSNAAGSVLSNSATLTVLTNSPPAGAITSPVNGTNYRGRQVITFSGTGTDPEDGNLPPSAFTWRVDFHHDDHVHPHVPATSGITTGTFTIADRGETSANVFYRVILTVRDSSGLTNTSQVDVRPFTSVVRIESNIANAQLTLDGAPITAPFSFTGVEGVIRTLGVVTPQTAGGISYDFANWSDGGQATHEIVTPNNDTTFTALFQPAATTTVFSDTFEAAQGWTLTSGANTAPRGRWARGDPQPTTFNGTTLQLGTCDGPSVNCFVTGLAAGSAVGSGDVDEGMTSVQSPTIAIPAGGTVTLRFRYFFAHNNNANSADYFRARVVGTNGQPQTVFTRPGAAGVVAGGAWTTQSVNISSFAGQTVRLRFEAADVAAGSIIEAGFDNVSVTRQ
jgi:glucose/arabinose dehydrogenase